MVAHRSPKPLVWVRILVPLPVILKRIVLTILYFFISERNDFLKKVIYSLIILTFFICIFFIPFFSSSNIKQLPSEKDLIFLGNSLYAWPIPGYTTLSSKFGKRVAPTTGASTFHKGIDIPAPEGTNLIATCDGIITFIGFLGGGGYTITLTNYDGIKISYCHVSPNYIVSTDEIIKQGQIIGNVGPKYVYGVSGNNYSDPSNGKPTNGATTGCHLHIGFRIENNYVNPLDYLQ